MVSKKQLREIIKELRINQKEAEAKLEKAQQKINEVKAGIVEVREWSEAEKEKLIAKYEKIINDYEAYIAELKEQIANLEKKTDDAQTEIDQAQELLKINAEHIDALEETIENGKRFINKMDTTVGIEQTMVNDHGIEINSYRNKIAKCERLIKKGINVEINKGLIEQYEAQIRYQQNQKEARIMNELDATNKRNGAKNRVIKNEAELAKRKEWSKMTAELFGVDK